MDSLSLVFLGLIALGSLLQGAFLIGLALSGLRIGRRIEELRKGLERELRPSLDNLNRITGNLAAVSELAVRQGRRVDELLAETVAKVDATVEELRRLTLGLLAPLEAAAALVKGVRRGLDVYQQLGGLEARDRGSTRRYRDDEHLFI